jgi:NitT/TauT family transport system substrate-binding protein
MRRRTALAAIGSTFVVAARSAGAQSLPAIRVIGPPLDGFKATYYGIQSGIFRKFGLNVEALQINSGAAAVAALVSGDADVGLTNITTFVNAHNKGVAIQIISPGAVFSSDRPIGTGILVRKDSPIQSGRDINGQTVASIDLDATAAAGIKAWVGSSGGDPSSIKFIEAPSAVAVQMLEDGRVAVAVVNEPVLSDALARGKTRVAADPMAAIAKRFLLAVYTVMAPAAAQKADAMRRFASAMHESQVYVNAHLPETVDLVAAYTKTAPDVVAHSARIIDGEYVDADTLQPIVDALARNTPNGKSAPLGDLVSPYALKRR